MTSTQPTQAHSFVGTDLTASAALASNGAITAPPSTENDRGSGRVKFAKSLAAPKARSTKAKPPASNGSLRLIAIGSRETIINNMRTLHMMKYADIGDWSKLQRGPNPGEFMSVLTLRSPHPWMP